MQGAEALKARAESIAADMEPELTLAVDAIFPSEVLAESLKALAAVFPLLPVTLYTEGLGGAEQRLRDGVAHLGLYVPFTGTAEDREVEFLMTIPTVPVVAAGHPLAAEPPPLGQQVLEDAVQLVLTDRTPAHRRALGRRHQPPHLALRRSRRRGSNSCSPASAGATCRSTWCASTSPPAG